MRLLFLILLVILSSCSCIKRATQYNPKLGTFYEVVKIWKVSQESIGNTEYHGCKMKVKIPGNNSIDTHIFFVKCDKHKIGDIIYVETHKKE